jgi:hypothetical protein
MQHLLEIDLGFIQFYIYLKSKIQNVKCKSEESLLRRLRFIILVLFALSIAGFKFPLRSCPMGSWPIDSSRPQGDRRIQENATEIFYLLLKD